MKLKMSTEKLKTTLFPETRLRFDMILEFNRSYILSLPYIIFDKEATQEITASRVDDGDETLSEAFSRGKSIACKAVRNSYIKLIIDSLPLSDNRVDAKIDRMLAKYKRDKGKVDEKCEWSIFATVMNTLERDYTMLRVQDSNCMAWEATFKGEGSADEGGPFRESIENIVDEIQSTSLPLLIPTQNNKNDHGLNRDCWTINPSSTSPLHLEMYKFFGALLGMAFRSGHVMDFKFPPLFWKTLIEDPLTIEDLASSDLYAVQAITDLNKNKDQIPPDMFEDMMELTYTTQLSNGETVPITQNGENKRVKFDEIDEYHNLIIKTRLSEGYRQMESIKEGFNIVFPISNI